MSDEVLIINTGQDLPKPKPLEPLPLYDENHYMLQQTMPEYKEALPNAYMNNLVTRLQMTMKKFSGIGGAGGGASGICFIAASTIQSNKLTKSSPLRFGSMGTGNP